MNNIKLDMLSIDWSAKLESMNCEDSFSSFHDILMSSLDTHCPEKRVIKNGRKSIQPWVTNGIKKCISKQQMLYKIFLEDKTDISKVEKYRKYKQVLQKTIRHAKNSYYSKLCTTHR